MAYQATSVATFQVVVGRAINSPVIDPIPAQVVNLNETNLLTLPVTAHSISAGEFALSVAGLPGDIAIRNMQATPLTLAATLEYIVPSMQGNYILNIAVSDIASGGYTLQQVKIAVRFQQLAGGRAKGVVYINQEPGGAPVISGDANGDGRVDLADAMVILTYALGGKKPANPEACNVNGDGSINIADAIYLLKYLFANGPAPK